MAGTLGGADRRGRGADHGCIRRATEASKGVILVSHTHPQQGARGDDRAGGWAQDCSPGSPRSPAVASSHREAPLTAADPQIDNTDLYAFVSPDAPDTVTFVSSWIPFEEPAGGPNFYLWAEHTNYDINIDNDGDANAGHHVPLELHDALPQRGARSCTTRVRSRR